MCLSSIVPRKVASVGITHLGMGGRGCNVTTWVYTLFKPTLASGNSCEVSGDSPAVDWPLTCSPPASRAPQRSSGAAAGQGDPAAAGARQHLWWQYYRQRGVWHGVPPRSSDLWSRNGCCGGQDPWEQRTGPPGHYRGRGRHALQAAPTVRHRIGIGRVWSEKKFIHSKTLQHKLNFIIPHCVIHLRTLDGLCVKWQKTHFWTIILEHFFKQNNYVSTHKESPLILRPFISFNGHRQPLVRWLID